MDQNEKVHYDYVGYPVFFLWSGGSSIYRNSAATAECGKAGSIKKDTQ
jgi:hypothetical protein